MRRVYASMSSMNQKMIIFSMLSLCVLGPLAVSAQERTEGPPLPIHASVEESRVIATSGIGKHAQQLELTIMGDDVVESGFQQLDQDRQNEFMVVSRFGNRNDEYYLQIIDFRPQGISTWSYRSYDRPVVIGRVIMFTGPEDLGKGDNNRSRFKTFTFRGDGLHPVSVNHDKVTALREALQTSEIPVHGSLPQSFYDQAMASIKELHVASHIIDHIRSGQINDARYALVTYREKAGSFLIHIDGIAVRQQKAFRFSTVVENDDYDDALLAIIQSIREFGAEGEISGPE